MVGLYCTYKVLIILSAFFMNWLFEIGAGVCDMMNGCLIGMSGCCSGLGSVLAIGALIERAGW